MVDRTRKTITVPAESVDIKYGTLKSAAEEIARLIAAHGEDARIDMHSLPYDDAEYLYVFKDVLETDAQMAARIAHEEKWEAIRADHDRKEFDRLSKLFGK